MAKNGLELSKYYAAFSKLIHLSFINMCNKKSLKQTVKNKEGIAPFAETKLGGKVVHVNVSCCREMKNWKELRNCYKQHTEKN